MIFLRMEKRHARSARREPQVLPLDPRDPTSFGPSARKAGRRARVTGHGLRVPARDDLLTFGVCVICVRSLPSGHDTNRSRPEPGQVGDDPRSVRRPGPR